MSKFEISFPSANGGIPYGILASKRALYDYADGKRISDTPCGTSFGLLLHGNSFNSLTVKVDGLDPLPDVSEDDIRDAAIALNPILVAPKDCAVSLYPINGQMRMSATATGMDIVAPGK